MGECIFCNIVAGEVPSARVYEDEHVVAILDINPVTPGHTLLLLKEHVAHLLEAEGDLLARLARVLPRVAGGVVAAAEAEGLNVLLNSGPAAGQLVPHLHLHLIPRRSGDGLRLAWQPGRYGPGEMETWRDRVARAIEEA